MSLTRWQPLRELSSMRQQMDSLFEDLLTVGRGDWLGLHNMGGMWTPAVEIKEADQELILKAEIPGIEVEDLDVKVGEDRVTISGEYEKEEVSEDDNSTYFHSEFHYGKFERVVPLPVPVKTDEIKSEFKNGILTLNLPKQEDIPKKVVKVNLEAN